MDDEKSLGLKLENQMCFHLYAAAREIIKRYTPILDEIGLTYTQYITMIVLWEQESLTVKELGRYLHLDSGTLTPLLKKLEEKGLVYRRRSEEDERNLIVTLTEAGWALRRQAEEVPVKYREQNHVTWERAQETGRLAKELLRMLRENL